MIYRKTLHRQTRSSFEPCESRFCLSTFAFALHNIECCVPWGARSVAAADLDGDADLDVLATASYDNGTIAWYENIDGKGRFSRERVISGEVEGASSIAAADMDGDGDLDVLSVSSRDNTIAWFDNVDGKGIFEIEQVISSPAQGARFVTAADVDGDGDLDLLAGTTYFDGRIAWYEQRLLGDANDDGVFDSSDLVRIFQAGKYDDGIVFNSTFDEGDWNGDGEFDSADLVLAFQAGHYEGGAAARMSDLAAAVDWLFSQPARNRARQVFMA